jgi:hypothetical protein
MVDIDRSAINFEPLGDETGNSTTAKPGSAKRAGFTKKNNGPWLKGGKGGKGPSAKVSKPTKTTGKFGAKKSGHAQGKGANSKIR